MTSVECEFCKKEIRRVWDGDLLVHYMGEGLFKACQDQRPRSTRELIEEAAQLGPLIPESKMRLMVQEFDAHITQQLDAVAQAERAKMQNALRLEDWNAAVDKLCHMARARDFMLTAREIEVVRLAVPEVAAKEK
jgi:uncharacterized protein HemX